MAILETRLLLADTVIKYVLAKVIGIDKIIKAFTKLPQNSSVFHQGYDNRNGAHRHCSFWAVLTDG